MKKEEEKEPENPLAFPCSVEGNEKEGWLPEVIQDGMTLRDYFAAKAMPLAPMNAHHSEDIANYCYELADEMLKARE